MKKDRRSFIVSSGIAAGAALMGQASARDEFAGLTTLEEKAVRLVSGYGQVAGREEISDGTVRIKAVRINHQQMGRLLSGQKRLPFGEIRVLPGNCLEIVDGKERIQIKHLS